MILQVFVRYLRRVDASLQDLRLAISTLLALRFFHLHFLVYMHVAWPNSHLLRKLWNHIVIDLLAGGVLLATRLIFVITAIVRSLMATLNDIDAAIPTMPLGSRLLWLFIVEFRCELCNHIGLLGTSTACTVYYLSLCLEDSCTFESVVHILLLLLDLSRKHTFSI